MGAIKKILIVGGGSSGWMTAAMLRARLPADIQIGLVEASDIPIIGVGESTNPVTVHFHTILGLDEKAFMRASNAAYKVAIRFEGFNRRGGHYYHTFGIRENKSANFFQPNAERQLRNFHVAELRNVFSKECAFAYQLDAGLYGQHLKSVCKQKGVQHIVDRIRDVELDERGHIARIHTDASGPLTADLYIDCSGFRSLLLGKALGEPFHPVGRYLLNDRAIAARMPYIDKERELENCTTCKGLSAGWAWNIPLWSRIGAGYVYSSQFLSASAAEAEFRGHLGEARVKDLEFNHIAIRAGRHERAWVGNCVAIGISYGFLEPLESTGLSLTQIAIIDLSKALAQGVSSSVERELFNRRQIQMFDATRDFVIAHFVLTARDDSPYWRYIRYENPLPDSLSNILSYARQNRYDPLDAMCNSFYVSMNWNLILSGMGFFDRGGLPQSPEDDSLKQSNGVTHARFLADAIYDGDYEEPALQRDQRSDVHPVWSPTW